MQRPVLFNYDDLAAFVRDMLLYRKHEDKSFTVAEVCESFERCSTSLVSSIASGRRKLTLDRVSDFAVLLQLSPRERFHLKEMLKKKKGKIEKEEKSEVVSPKRRRTSAFLLSDWINPYVKDATRLISVQKSREAIFKVLGGIASRKRIEQSIKFLLAHGYLRLNQNGQWVESEVLNVLGDRNASLKIRQFHKKALEIAKEGVDTYPIEERLAQALLLPLDEESYAELVELIREFSEKLQNFSEAKSDRNKRLYQIIFHLTPTGGTCE